MIRSDRAVATARIIGAAATPHPLISIENPVGSVLVLQVLGIWHNVQIESGVSAAIVAGYRANAIPTGGTVIGGVPSRTRDDASQGIARSACDAASAATAITVIPSALFPDALHRGATGAVAVSSGPLSDEHGENYVKSPDGLWLLPGEAAFLQVESASSVNVRHLCAVVWREVARVGGR